MARLEVIGAGLIADREVIPQALKLNAPLFSVLYVDLLNRRKTPRSVKAALDTADDYLASRALSFFDPLFHHLQEVLEARSATEIDDYFVRNYGIEGVVAGCEYLAEQGLIGKASVPLQLTHRSSTTVEELAFFYLQPEPQRSPQ